MQVLVADDSLVSRKILEKIVQGLACETVLASDGQEAWDIIEAGDAPPILLLDWMMPGLDGIEVCRRVRQRPSKSPPYIMLLSAKQEKNDIVEGLDAGANDYLTKPYNKSELIARIRVGLRVVRLQRELNARISELEGARSRIKTLQQFLPVCMYCRKVSPDDSMWSNIEQYVEEHSDIELSHVICPDCMLQHHPDMVDEPEDG